MRRPALANSVVRSLLAVTLAALGSACTSGTGAEAGPDAGAVEQPDGSAPEPNAAVSVDTLVLQAQVEPFRGDQPSLPGDDSVERVQQALLEEGFDISVDGWFGRQTAAAYSAWQKKLGYEGLAANGIPGPASLAALGEGRFELTDPVAVGSVIDFRGRRVNERTRDMLVAAEAILGRDLVITQGSYNAGGVSASAGTHDGGGALDISVRDLNTTQRWQTIKALRTVGFAAWLRTPDQGPWPYHIHAISIADTDLATSARDQVADYFAGLNGLASHAPDNTPAEYQVPFTWWEQYNDR